MDTAKIAIFLPKTVLITSGDPLIFVKDFETVLKNLKTEWKLIFPIFEGEKQEIKDHLQSLMKSRPCIECPLTLSLNNLIEEYLSKGIKAYDIAVVCGLSGDILEIAHKHQIRTIWYTKVNLKIKDTHTEILARYKPHFCYGWFLQLEPIFGLIIEDSSYFSSNKLDLPPSELYKDEEAPSKQRIHVKHYFFESKEKEIYKQGGCIGNKQILYEPLLLNYPLELQEPYDVLLHKFSDIIAEEISEKKHQLYTYVKSYFETKPDKIIIDSITSLCTVNYREKLIEALKVIYETPKFKEIERKHGEKSSIGWSYCISRPEDIVGTCPIETDMKTKGAKFPLIVKTQCASRSKSAHIMGVVRNAVGLEKCLNYAPYTNTPLIIQDCIRHTSHVFKCYLFHTHFDVIIRKSLPSNFPWEDDYLIFQSQKGAPMEWFDHSIEAPSINMDYLKDISFFIAKELNMSMIGLDFIIEEETGCYYLLDINYFSSCSHLPDISHLLHNIILKKYFAHKKVT